MVCLMGSAVYHLFGTANAKWAGVLGTLDFIGITALIVGSFVPILYYGFYEQYLYRTFYISVICALGCVLLVLALTPLFHDERYRGLRTMLFTGLGLCGVVPVTHMLIHHEFDELSRSTFWGTLLTGGAYLCGTAFYLSRFPEVLAPGRFDLILSSHNIWHMMVVFATCLHYAFVLELWHERSNSLGTIGGLALSNATQ
jgi:adiponectin receptor